jgi:glucosamine--fructose-6-phosphate aminotransferase (isomerizing)
MCGIVGAVAARNVVPMLIEGLSRLEYRGYDSAGIAVLNNGIERVRAVGRVAAMQDKATAVNLTGLVGIGHTRWATHGGVTESNAHPHVSKGEIAVVHNGIIENHDEQRTRLRALGYVFESQTDTEVIAHLIHYYSEQGLSLLAATQKAVAELTGAFAISVISVKSPDTMICARLGCPLLIGLGEGENFIASDVSAVLSVTRRVIYLEDGDIGEIRRDRVTIYGRDGVEVSR